MRTIILKVSGRFFQDPCKKGYVHKNALTLLGREIQSIGGHIKLVIVPGGGNIARGRELIAEESIIPRAADYMGMMATAINSMALKYELKMRGMAVEFLNTLLIHEIEKPFVWEAVLDKALALLEKDNVVIIGGGTGIGGITTDTAAVLLARDLNAEIVLKGTDVEGVFTRPPKENKEATLIQQLTHQEFIIRNFGEIFDAQAAVTARNKGMPIRIFKFQEDSLRKAIGINLAEGERPIGTLIY